MWVPTTLPASAHMLTRSVLTLGGFLARVCRRDPSGLPLPLLSAFPFFFPLLLFSSLCSVIVMIILEHPPRSRHCDRCLSHNVSVRTWLCVFCVLEALGSQGSTIRGVGWLLSPPLLSVFGCFYHGGGGFASKDIPDHWLSPLPEEEGSALI